MQENYELVQRGFRILVASMASYIGWSGETVLFPLMG